MHHCPARARIRTQIVPKLTTEVKTTPNLQLGSYLNMIHKKGWALSVIHHANSTYLRNFFQRADSLIERSMDSDIEAHACMD